MTTPSNIFLEKILMVTISIEKFLFNIQMHLKFTALFLSTCLTSQVLSMKEDVVNINKFHTNGNHADIKNHQKEQEYQEPLVIEKGKRKRRINGELPEKRATKKKKLLNGSYIEEEQTKKYSPSSTKEKMGDCKNIWEAIEQTHLTKLEEFINNDPKLLEKTKGKKGFTPLRIAVENNNAEAVKLLCDRGADKNVKDYREKNTPLHIAAEKGYFAIVETLCKQACNVFQYNKRKIPGKKNCYNEYSSLDLAIKNNHLDVVDFFLKQYAASFNNEKMEEYYSSALRFNNLAALKIMEQRFESPFKDFALQTQPYRYVGRFNNYELLDYLKGIGFPPNHKIAWPALEGAVWNNHLGMVKHFVSLGMKPDTDILQGAARHNYTEMVQYLCSIKTPVDYGRHKVSPLLEAVRNDSIEMCKALLDYGADPFAQNVSSLNRDVPLDTPILNIIKNKRVDLLDLFLKKRPDLVEKLSKKAFYNAHYHISEECLKVLINRGIDPNMAFNNGETLLWGLVEREASLENVKLLIENGADPLKQSEGYRCQGWEKVKYKESALESSLRRYFGDSACKKKGYKECPLILIKAAPFQSLSLKVKQDIVKYLDKEGHIDILKECLLTEQNFDIFQDLLEVVKHSPQLKEISKIDHPLFHNSKKWENLKVRLSLRVSFQKHGIRQALIDKYIYRFDLVIPERRQEYHNVHKTKMLTSRVFDPQDVQTTNDFIVPSVIARLDPTSEIYHNIDERENNIKAAKYVIAIVGIHGNNRNILGITSESELYRKALDVLVTFDIVKNTPKDPLNIYKKHKEGLEITIETLTVPSETLGKKSYQIDREFFQQNTFKLNKDSVPYIKESILNDLTQTLHNKYNALSYENKRLFEKEVKDKTTIYWNALLQDSLRNPYMNELLKNRFKSIYHAYFACSMRYISQLPTNVRENSFLTEQEEILLKLASCTLTCTTGKNEGIASFYGNLPPEYSLAGKDSDSDVGINTMLTTLITKLLEDQFSGQNDLMRRLVGIDKEKYNSYLNTQQSLFTNRNALRMILNQNPNRTHPSENSLMEKIVSQRKILTTLYSSVHVKQPVHQALYLKNAIAYHVGLPHSIAYDRATSCLNDTLLGKSTIDLLKAFYSTFTPKHFVNSVKSYINRLFKKGERIKNRYYNNLAHYITNQSTAWEMDKDFNIIGITEDGTAQLLCSLGWLKDVTEAENRMTDDTGNHPEK